MDVKPDYSDPEEENLNNDTSLLTTANTSDSFESCRSLTSSFGMLDCGDTPHNTQEYDNLGTKSLDACNSFEGHHKRVTHKALSVGNVDTENQDSNISTHPTGGARPKTAYPQYSCGKSKSNSKIVNSNNGTEGVPEHYDDCAMDSDKEENTYDELKITSNKDLQTLEEEKFIRQAFWNTNVRYAQNGDDADSVACDEEGSDKDEVHQNSISKNENHQEIDGSINARHNRKERKATKTSNDNIHTKAHDTRNSKGGH